VALDIVCGKEVDKDAVNAEVGNIPAGAPETDPTKGTKSFYNSEWYYFCSMACRLQFLATPDEVIEKAGSQT